MGQITGTMLLIAMYFYRRDGTQVPAWLYYLVLVSTLLAGLIKVVKNREELSIMHFVFCAIPLMVVEWKFPVSP